MPAGAGRATIRQTLESVSHDQVWAPNSRSYIALGADGAGVAWVGKTYVVPPRDTLVALPGYEPGARDQCG
ncbi:MAG TPA: hypothetical protein VFG72_06780 [Marmoricola sp.]|nr:hypothetical protein [Marmoricola sp.]